MKIFSSLTTFLYLLVSSAAYAGLNTWTASGPNGGMIQAISIDQTNPNIIYAGSADNGLFRSIDSGTSWREINNGLTTLDIQVITLDPSLSTTLYIGTSTHGIYKSIDSGNTWVAINTGLINLNVYAIQVDPNNSNIIYAGTFGNVIKSLDGGATWGVVGNRANIPNRLYYNDIYDLQLDPNNSNTVYVGTASGGVWRSLNGGLPDWEELNNGLEEVSASNVRRLRFFNSRSLTISSDGNTLYVGTQGDGILKSTDSAANWTPVNNGLTEETIRILAMLPEDTTTVYAGTSTGLFFTRDSGATWAESSTEMNVLSLVINPNNAAELFAGTTEGVFRSTDSGVNWVAVNDGINSFAITEVAVHPTNSDIRYVGSRHSGIAKTIDGGINWFFVNTGISDLRVQSIVISPSAPETLYIGTKSGGVFKTFDGGVNWNALLSGIGNADVRKLVIDPNQPHIIYAGTRTGLLRLVDEDLNNDGTLDNGEDFNNNNILDNTWRPINNGIVGQHNIIVQAIAIDPDNTSTLLSSTASSGIFISTDSGANWSNSSVGLTNQFIYTLAITPGNANTIFAGTRGSGLFKSIDGGMSWFAINTGLASNDNDGIVNINAIMIDRTSPATIYVGTQDNGVYKSSDTGNSWVSLSNGLTNNTINSLTLVDSTPPTLLAGTEGQGVLEIQSSVSSGSATLTEAAIQNNNGGGSITFLSILLLFGLTWVRLFWKNS